MNELFVESTPNTMLLLTLFQIGPNRLNGRDTHLDRKNHFEPFKKFGGLLWSTAGPMNAPSTLFRNWAFWLGHGR